MALGKLNRLDLLASIYGQVRMTHAVYAEVVTAGLVRGEPDALVTRLFWQQQGWPVVDVPANVLSAYQPAIVLDAGETEVLALAQTLANPLVLLDDEAARAEARRLNLPTRGTLGMLVQAYRQQHVSYAELDLLLQAIAARPDIWISARLCQQILGSLPKP